MYKIRFVIIIYALKIYTMYLLWRDQSNKKTKLSTMSIECVNFIIKVWWCCEIKLKSCFLQIALIIVILITIRYSCMSAALVAYDMYTHFSCMFCFLYLFIYIYLLYYAQFSLVANFCLFENISLSRYFIYFLIPFIMYYYIIILCILYIYSLVVSLE